MTTEPTRSDPDAIATFWASCRAVVGGLPEAVPEAWAFGAGADQADRLLDLVLRGTKTATAPQQARRLARAPTRSTSGARTTPTRTYGACTT